jgi:hypothetical protein
MPRKRSYWAVDVLVVVALRGVLSFAGVAEVVSSTILLTSLPFEGAWRWLAAASMTREGRWHFSTQSGSRYAQSAGSASCAPKLGSKRNNVEQYGQMISPVSPVLR